MKYAGICAEKTGNPRNGFARLLFLILKQKALRIFLFEELFEWGRG